MGPEFEKAINELSLRMRMLRAIQEDSAASDALTERESLILQLLSERGQMTVTQIADAWPNVSESTVSMTITKLWRERQLVSKTISPENQRVTLVELTDKGHEELDAFLAQRNQRISVLFNSINTTEEEKKVLIDVCQRGARFLDQFLRREQTGNE